MTIPTNVVASNGVGVISDDQANTYVQTDQTASQLRGFIGNTGMSIMLQGLTAPGDGGAGLFYWAIGNFTDDGLSTIVPPGAAGQGAWLRSSSLYGAPKYTAASLPAVTSANQGQIAYATNARNAAEASGAGSGAVVSVNKNGVWACVWSGVAPTI